MCILCFYSLYLSCTPRICHHTRGMSTTFELTSFLNRNIPWGVAQIVKMGEKEFPKDPVGSGRADWAKYHPRDRERYATDRDMGMLFSQNPA
ncbi:hypothetical protein M427DRAFT_230195 [Gonapodya prolifera JEL478]|uniref:Uncharacterized protein n=1 Tax=Gonapodya prolifera (strain JEL478) TaxID=1344416 RepID=A0A138ZYU1_GONPJ|nr:hypothetical protein M427DRAFT_230195 [Gonapodya prolifera JEL478]|eukprot:KXS09445.1 hypothetical protein M427DRAFT_230195 [Gonapodya prolifera JEL478]